MTLADRLAGCLSDETRFAHVALTQDELRLVLAALALAEANSAWMESAPCSTAFHRGEEPSCSECEQRAVMMEALDAYRASREKCKEEPRG